MASVQSDYGILPSLRLNGIKAKASATIAKTNKLSSDSIRFGKIPNATFLLPPNSTLLCVHGMGDKSDLKKSTYSTLQDMVNGLNRNGHDTYDVTVPGIVKASDTRISTQWLLDYIDNVRAKKTQKNLTQLLAKIAPLNKQAQHQQVISHFGLDNSRLSQSIAYGILDLLKHPNIEPILSLDANAPFDHNRPKAERERLAPLLADLTTALEVRLAPALENTYAAEQLETALPKISHRIMDTLAPQVVVIGHSLGGFVGTHAIKTPDSGIGLNVALGSPVNGREYEHKYKIIPKPVRDAYFEALTHAFGRIKKALYHMSSDSGSTERLRNTPLPLNKTTIAAGVANDMDYLVMTDSAKVNDTLPGHLSLSVKPKKGYIPREGLENISDKLNGHAGLLKAFPWTFFHGKALEAFMERFDGVLYHFGIAQHFEDQWPQDGEFLKQVLDTPGHLGHRDGKEALSRITRLLDPQNYDPMRSRLIELISDRITDRPKDKALFKPLVPLLNEIGKSEPLPFKSSVASQAASLAAQLCFSG